MAQISILHSGQYQNRMIDSLFILGEDKQIVLEKHWKGVVGREVLEPFYSALAECVNSDVNDVLIFTLFLRMFHLFSRVVIVPLLQ